MSNSARRHHRVAEKRVELSHEKGIIIPPKEANCLLLFFVTMLFVVFFKGIVIGQWLANRDCD